MPSNIPLPFEGDPFHLQGRTFSGERLQLAREFKGLTQQKLGDEVAASNGLVSVYEKGKRAADPPKDLVEAFGLVLGFEPAFFYEQGHDLFREEECSFRHRRSTPEKTKTQIRAHATLIGMVIDRLRSHFHLPKLDVPSLPAKTIEEIETAAEQCRIHWKLGIQGPIMQVGRALENAGVIIVPHLVKSMKVDAFSRNGATSVIFLNRTIPSHSRWNFDIAHECGHLVIHQGVTTGEIETEAAADRFASAFLMPRKSFAREFSFAPFSWKHVFDMKRYWQASAAAIVRRAYDLGLIGAVVYRQAYKYMSAQGWLTQGEPDEPSFQPPEILNIALTALGTKVELTIEQLRAQLHFKPETFHEVTGVAVPIPTPVKKTIDVIQFPKS
jgi:Zn-dependent peptidase ImmA (M78 family)/transcriptional regulator with XRE-family HTH domain